MDTMTITEGLAEIKTITARIAKRREAIMRYFARDARIRDPLEADGGSVEFVRRERQAIGDLEERLVRIRTAIQQANLNTTLALHGQTRSVSAWLNWRRDVSAGSKAFLGLMAANISKVRADGLKVGSRIVDAPAADSAKPGEIVVVVNEQALAKEIEEMEALLGDLDGRFSLLNATTMISF